MFRSDITLKDNMSDVICRNSHKYTRPPKNVDEKNQKKEINPSFKNVGFVNYKWTEIVVGDEEECMEVAREEMKEVIIRMSKREEKNPINGWTDNFVRVNHRAYVPVEV